MSTISDFRPEMDASEIVRHVHAMPEVEDYHRMPDGHFTIEIVGGVLIHIGDDISEDGESGISWAAYFDDDVIAQDGWTHSETDTDHVRRFAEFVRGYVVADTDSV